jgi:GH15 family glucan-1,4-alpha-glucosidase
MSLPIEDYALIGNMHTAALVGRDGSIDWLCVPHFDSPACFAALLGGPEHGRWLIAPTSNVRAVHRGYQRDALVLETIFTTEDGEVALIDFMPINDQNGRVDVIRLVEGRKGCVAMRMELILRFDYGAVVPWISQTNSSTRWIGGPDAVLLHSPVELQGDNFETEAAFKISKGETLPFTLIRNASHLPAPEVNDPVRLRAETEVWWKEWISRSDYNGPYREQVRRSLITLKALTYRPTGAIVAAPTTSLPEHFKGSLNWDYRYCWLRDASFTVCALVISGYSEETNAWREWLLRAVAGQADKLQIMYGLNGERRLKEFELSDLPGYEDSRPVRAGNAAHEQFQLDIYGEILNALYIAHQYKIRVDHDSWQRLRMFLEFLEIAWVKPDDGMWEVRTGARHFTESKVAA